MSTTPETTPTYQCPDCATIYVGDDLVPIYECSRCNQTSIERRCEDDNIFMARTGVGCESCGVEADEVEAVEDHDGQLILAEDWDPEDSKASRDAVEADRVRREHDERLQKESEARAAASEGVAASAVVVGDWIMHPEPREWDPDGAVEVKEILHWGGGTLGFVVGDFGLPQVFPVPPGHMLTRVPPEETGRQQGDPFGAVIFNPDGGRMFMSSTPHEEEYVIELAHITRGEAPWGDVPCLVICRYTPGLLNVFGVFVDREHAEAALGVWEQAGRALAEARGVEAVAIRASVRVEEKPFSTFTDSLGRLVEFTIGVSEWEESELPSLNVRTSGSNATVQDAGALLAVAEVARECLEHLDH